MASRHRRPSVHRRPGPRARPPHRRGLLHLRHRRRHRRHQPLRFFTVRHPLAFEHGRPWPRHPPAFRRQPAHRLPLWWSRHHLRRCQQCLWHRQRLAQRRSAPMRRRQRFPTRLPSRYRRCRVGLLEALEPLSRRLWGMGSQLRLLQPWFRQLPLHHVQSLAQQQL